jgi:hypothetical protein
MTVKNIIIKVKYFKSFSNNSKAVNACFKIVNPTHPNIIDSTSIASYASTHTFL